MVGMLLMEWVVGAVGMLLLATLMMVTMVVVAMLAVGVLVAVMPLAVMDVFRRRGVHRCRRCSPGWCAARHVVGPFNRSAQCVYRSACQVTGDYRLATSRLHPRQVAP